MLEPPLLSFGRRLKELRLRVKAKQVWLSSEIGCTDAAISFWESDRRLPREPLVLRLLDVLGKSGAMPDEIVALHSSWRETVLHARRRFLPSFLGHRAP